MRPFYRKDLFRDEIVTSNPIMHQVKIDSEEMKFETLRMEKGQSISFNTEQYEVGIIILVGTATIQSGKFIADSVGQRKDVFSGKPTAVYIPCESKFQIKAVGYGTLEIVICKVKAKKQGAPYLIEPDKIEVQEKGVFNWKRTIHEIFTGLGESRLVVGETYGCPGQWAVYPYKDEESKAVYHFKVSPAPTKPIQVMRSIENPKVYYIQDNTTLMMQSTYVPVPEAEEKVYFLWFKIAE